MIRFFVMAFAGVSSLMISARTLEDVGFSVEEYNDFRMASRTAKRPLIEKFKTVIGSDRACGYICKDILSDDPLQDELKNIFSNKYPELYVSMVKCAGNMNNPIMLQAGGKLLEVLKETSTYGVMCKMASEQGFDLKIGVEKIEMISCPDGKRCLFILEWRLRSETGNTKGPTFK